MKNCIHYYANNCLVVTCLAITMAFASPVFGTTLTKGDFNCVVSVVEPPSGTGIPRGTVSVSFQESLGIIGGPVSDFRNFGTGDGLDQVCQSLADSFSQLATNLNCAVGAIQATQVVGVNFTDDRWSFGIVCKGDPLSVVNAVGFMLEGMLTIPNIGAQTLSSTSNEIRKSDLNILNQNQ